MIVDYLGGLVLPDTPVTGPAPGPAAALAAFRREFYQCLSWRADALFVLTDAMLSTPLAARIVTTFVVLAPLGICLGMFMPLGLGAVSVWYWYAQPLLGLRK